MKLHGGPCGPHGAACGSKGPHGGRMGPLGPPWNLLWRPHGVPPGAVWTPKRRPHGRPVTPHGAHGGPLCPMKPYGACSARLGQNHFLGFFLMRYTLVCLRFHLLRETVNPASHGPQAPPYPCLDLWKFHCSCRSCICAPWPPEGAQALVLSQFLF